MLMVLQPAAARVTWAGGCLLLLVLGASWAYGLAARDSLVFLVCIFTVFYAPGSLLAGLALRREEWALGHMVLSLAIGLTVFPLLYHLMRGWNLDPAWLVVVVAVQVSAWSVLRWRGRLRVAVQPQGELPGLGALLLFALVLLHLTHFTDLVLRADGISLRNSHLTESVFHLGLLNALTDVFPPPAIYAAGSDDYRWYHLYMHLQMELVARLGHIPTLQLAYFYFPGLYIGLLVALPFVLTRHFGGSVPLAVACGALVFGSDFSFIPGLLLRPEAQPWTLYFPSSIYALFTLNGYLPAQFALFSSVMIISLYFRNGGASHLALVALCVLGAYGLKSSMGLQLAAAVVVASAACWFWNRKYRLALCLFCVGLGLLGLLFSAGLLTVAASNANAVIFAPFGLFRDTLTRVGLGDVDIVWYPVLWISFIVAALGVRTVGLWAAWEQARKRAKPDASLVFTAAFVVIGYAVSEMFFIGNPGGIDNARWFFSQASMAAWIPLFWALAQWRVPERQRLMAVALIALLSAPVTMQFLNLRTVKQYADFGTDDLAVVEFLRATPADSVVLHPLDLDRPSLAANLAGRSSVLSPFLSFVEDSAVLSQRVVDVRMFFSEEGSTAQRRQILQRYGVDFVYLPARDSGLVANLPGLQPAFRNPAWIVFRVSSAATGACATAPCRRSARR